MLDLDALFGTIEYETVFSAYDGELTVVKYHPECFVVFHGDDGIGEFSTETDAIRFAWNY